MTKQKFPNQPNGLKMTEELKLNDAQKELLVGFIFLQYYDKDGYFSSTSKNISSQQREIVQLGLEKIKNQIMEIGLPIIYGKLRGNGNSMIFLAEPDFTAHKDLFTPGSVCVIEKQVETNEEGDDLLNGFEVGVRLGVSGTWLRVGMVLPEPGSDDDDDEDYSEDDEDREIVTKEEKQRIAVIAATSHGFRELKNRQQRMAFVEPIIEAEASGKEWDGYLRPEHEIAEMAAELYELGIIPKRAQASAAQGKTAAEVGKLLGISKQKAERAIAAEIPQYIADQLTDLSDDE